MKLDILVFAAHPDDAELGCGGTIIKQINLGYKVGVIDLTQGELGTRGSIEIRKKESEKSAKILKLSVRENLKMRDGFFEINEENKRMIIEKIRFYRPKIILANASYDRHIDHGRGSRLTSEACFLSGLSKIKTFCNGKSQEAWRPNAVYHYIQDRYIKPDLVVDITNEFKAKMEAINAYSSQFYNPKSTELKTPISGKDFLNFVKSRSIEYGRTIQVKYGEGFSVERNIGVGDIMSLL